MVDRIGQRRRLNKNGFKLYHYRGFWPKEGFTLWNKWWQDKCE